MSGLDVPEAATDPHWLIAAALLVLTIQQRIEFETIDKPDRNEDHKDGYK